MLPQLSMFLDKACIHQTNREKKLKGIKQLGAVLRYSERMLVMWQPEYFKRTWCVFEMAAFLHMKGSAKVDMVPLKLPAMASALFLFHFIASLALFLLHPVTIGAPWHVRWAVHTFDTPPLQACYLYGLWVVFLGLGLYAIPSFFLWTFCKGHVRDRRNLLQELRGFQVANASCSVESDGIFVQAAIRRWFGSLSEFENFVRTDLAAKVESMLTRRGPVPYKFVLVGSLPHLFLGITHSFSSSLQFGELESAMHIAITTTAMTLFTDAISVNLTLRLADTAFGDVDEGHSSFFARRLAGPLATTGIFSIVNALIGLMFSPVLGFSFSLVCLGILAIVTWFLFSRNHLRAESALESTQTETSTTA